MTINTKKTTPAEVLMLMGKQCTFCGPMMVQLTELMKSGYISRLEIIDIEQDPALASELGVRSVPWLQIGPFELAGARKKSELLSWLERASSYDGITAYIEEVLIEGKIDLVEKLIVKKPDALDNVIALMADPEAKINIRLGVGVVIEEYAATEVFKRVVPKLLEFLSAKDARIRGDACHYLSLTGDATHIPAIEKLLDDDNEEVREIASESIEALQDAKQ